MVGLVIRRNTMSNTITEADIASFRRVIDTLESLGIKTLLEGYTPLEGQYYHFKFDEAVRHLQSGQHTDINWAASYGVSMEHFRRVKDFYASDFNCTGTTRDGRPCRALVCGHGEAPEVRDFILGKHDRCRHHQVHKQSPA
jgi:hypothetical protein